MCKWGTDALVRLRTPMPISGRTEIAVDACLAPIVQALNDGGIDTVACCCGHGKGIGRIDLADGRVLWIGGDMQGDEPTREQREEDFAGREPLCANCGWPEAMHTGSGDSGTVTCTQFKPGATPQARGKTKSCRAWSA